MVWITRAEIRGPVGTFDEASAVALPNGAAPTATIGGTPENRTVVFGIPAGDQGLPGVNAVPADTAVAAYISTLSSETRGALNNTIVEEDLDIPAKFRNIPGLTWLYTMQTGHGWTTTGTVDSSNLNDTSDPGLGSQCVSYVTSAGVLSGGLIKGSLSLDLTGKSIVILAKYEGAVADISSIRVDVGPNGLASYYRAFVCSTDRKEREMIQPGEWVMLMIPWARFAETVSGTPNRAAIGAIRVVVADSNGANRVTFKLGAVGTFDEGLTRYPNGAVSFSFDDSFDDHYTAALPAMNVYGYRGTLYPIVSRFDEAGYLTTAQVLELARKHGWEIGAHAYEQVNHTDLRELDADVIDGEMRDMRRWLRENGLPIPSYAYPQGVFDTDVTAIVQRYFPSAASNASRTNTPVTNQLMRLYRVGLTTSLSLAAAKAYVDQVKAGKSWVIFMVHDIVASSPTSSGWLVSDFQELVAYIASESVSVAPVIEVVNAT